jgi:superfamily I DNA/RNA helicase
MPLPEDLTLYIRVWTQQACAACGAEFRQKRKFKIMRRDTYRDDTIEQIEQYALTHELALWTALERMLEERAFPARAESALSEFHRFMKELAEGIETRPPTEALNNILDRTGYRKMLEEEGTEKPMRALATILTLPYTRNESGSYAWPTAYSERPTEEAWQALVDAGLYTQEQIDSMKTAGSYLGWRTAITADGDWQFFVAGD